MGAPASQSLIDLVDRADRVVGTIPRGDVFRARAGFRVVHIFVFDHTGRLLLQQLGRSRSRNPLRLGSSVAGYLHAGESYPDGAVRRLREELGLLSNLHKRGAISMEDQGCLKFVELFETHARCEEPEIREPTHIERLVWHSISEIDLAVRQAPERFTPTFRNVYRLYRSTADMTEEGE